MANLTLTIEKSDIYEEVAKTTAYIGAKNKLEDGKSAFDQVFVTDADLTMIERFLNESLDALRNVLKRFISVGSVVDGTITWQLEVSSRFDDNLLESIKSSAKLNDFSMSLADLIFAKESGLPANDDAEEQ